MTNMLILYRAIEEAADKMAASMGYGVGIGFAAVLTGQVLLYGFWAGIAQTAKQKRAGKAIPKKPIKKTSKE
jgi:flagellar motor component MotA